jgi:hypothetical protein
MKSPTLFERDIQAVRAYRRACTGGNMPGADSPIAKAAARAVKRQEARDPSTDFVVKALGEAPIDQRMQDAAVAWGRRQAATAPPKLPVPDNDAVGILRRSLAGQGVVDLAGAGASTIGSDVADGQFLAKLKSAEQARVAQNDPLFGEAMTKAKATAVRKGRSVKAEDFNAAMAEVRAARGPQPYTPPQPVVALLTGTAAKSTTSSLSPVPDRFRG